MSDPNTLDGALEWLAASNFRAKIMAAYGNGDEAHRIFPAIHPHVPALMTVADHADELARLRALNEELVGALDDCSTRLRACVVNVGTDPEYADVLVQKYRAVVARAKGGSDAR